MHSSNPPPSKSEAVPSENKPAPKPVRKPKSVGPRLNGASREARQLASAILEVIGGTRLPSDAAAALSISLPRYYLLESRALNGLIAACEPRPIGRVRSAESELNQTQKEVTRLQQECARYAALVRAAQRTVGLAPPPPPKPNDKGKLRRKRKPTVRALRAVEVLKSQTSGETEAGNGGDRPAEG
jgi:hypothetical protein